MTETVAVVIPFLENEERLRACINAARSQATESLKIVFYVFNNGKIVFYVFNNGKEHFKEDGIHVLNYRRNTGWAKANNFGIEFSLTENADLIVLLNDDVRVHPGFFQALLDFKKSKPDAGIFGCKILYSDKHTLSGKIQAAGGTLKDCYELGKAVHECSGFDANLATTPFELDCVYEAAMAINPSILTKGKRTFDENLFLGFEGPDLCFQMAKKGYKSYYVPGAVCEHDVASTWNNASKWTKAMWTIKSCHNRLYFAIKHYGFRDGVAKEQAYFKTLPIKPHTVVLEAYSYLWNIVFWGLNGHSN